LTKKKTGITSSSAVEDGIPPVWLIEIRTLRSDDLIGRQAWSSIYWYKNAYYLYHCDADGRWLVGSWPAYHVQIQANHASIGYAPQQLLGQRIGMASGTNGTAGKSDRLHRGHRPSGQIGE
jgi:hypothetical protein